MPNLYVICGANGSGKTTVALKILPHFLNTFEYVNADSIAVALSPFNPESVAIQAGKLMLKRLNQLVQEKRDFAFETTLAGRQFTRFLQKCKNEGYLINLIYFWLDSPDLAIERVQKRVKSGGHNIPEEVIRRRYQRGLVNFNQLYLPLCDAWMVYNNSGDTPQLVAVSSFNQTPIIYDSEIFRKLTTSS